MNERALQTWRLFLEAHARLTADLEVELRERTGMSLAWYDVLVQLSEAPQGRLRMQELARAVLLSKSGLSRLVDRLCDAGYLEREPDPIDGRATLAAITTRGRRALRRAAPIHLEGVERSFVTPLSSRQLEGLSGACRAILAQLDEAGSSR